MLSLQTLSDRVEIEAIMVDYVNAIDTRDFAALERVFTPDAWIDYTAMGGIKGHFPEVQAWLAQVLPHFPAYYHLIGNVAITLEGDQARSRSACFNPMTVRLEEGTEQTFFLGLWYHDQWQRTEAGWRIRERVEEKCFDHNVPAALAVGAS
ncbi:nuclear transport factor 2 family protein [Algiphilus sp.]|jgi:ketosteroid isomerase-like protein|uniref:nuclear transport factor 2 family protein n=1 Tax=Algiphilus sp. TaxID=1872431 RepID=UPI001CA79D8A|nr:nuclear transport factor 2 family protein [Algiphilus sp.]MBY8966556.1 nuclear transport factor 2 family protein [Algiphilus acroporae]MCI5061381.1 nuclear transport factor 2 family protein [Algiphilus sp.]MCI5104114.1 nuclear transport factor 2 family protein [Algiphilus sp.]MCR9092364.1 nuclear transport factor 2 family protein [Pseudomonadota bacterium]